MHTTPVIRRAVNVDFTTHASLYLLGIAHELVRPPASTAQLLHSEGSKAQCLEQDTDIGPALSVAVLGSSAKARGREPMSDLGARLKPQYHLRGCGYDF